MNPSAIAEAIEQDRPSFCRTYTITGHSDDIVEVEGSEWPTALEFYPSKAASTLTIYDAVSHTPVGKVIIMLVNDQWGFGIAPYSDGVPLPIGEYSLSASGYSTTLTIRTQSQLAFEDS